MPQVIDNIITDIMDKTYQNISTSEYLDFYKQEKVYTLLPESKVINSIYGIRSKHSLKTVAKSLKVIDEFNALFIDKKVYRYSKSDGSLDRTFAFQHMIINENSLVIGDAGCGKSTLLFKIYINLVKSIKENKVIPIFLDLNKIVSDNVLLSEIEKVAKFNLCRHQMDLITIFSELKLQGYYVLLILDSLDESKSTTLLSEINSLCAKETRHFFLNASGIPFNVCIGLRKGLFDTLDNRFTNKFQNYTVRNFDQSDVVQYIEKLTKLNRIKKEQIPSSVVEVGQYIFEQCTKLENINFNYNNIELKDGTFICCLSLKSLDSIHISKEINSIPKTCFSTIDCLENLDFTEYKNLKAINNYAFIKCKNLKEVILPKSLEYLGLAVFNECESLNKIVFNSKPVVSAYALGNITKSIEVVIDDVSRNCKTSEQFIDFLKSQNIEVINDKIIGGITFEHIDENKYRFGYSFNRTTQGLLFLMLNFMRA